MKVLIVGGTGFLGGELVRLCAASGHDVGATCLSTRPRERAGVVWLPVDLRSRQGVCAALAEFRPDVTINAAYRQGDWATTADGAAHVAVAVASTGGRLVHVSSDAVFSGARPRYDEACPPDPVTPYGAAKAAAETAVRAVLPGAVIARTSLIVGDGASVHEALVRALAAGGGDGRVLFTDDVRCPVHVRDLASALLEAAGAEPPDEPPDEPREDERGGVLHVAGADAVSRYELGVLIARRDGLDPARLPSGRRADAGVAGPLDVRLDCTATQRRLTTRLRGAREFLSVPLA